MPDKQQIFNDVASKLKELGFTIVGRDDTRPWGGFYVIDEEETARFAEIYFPGEGIGETEAGIKLSPKILIIAPGCRLSWQYHLRRSEIWKCIGGRVGVITSDTDEEKSQYVLQPGEIIRLKQAERHRLIGLDDWGIIAEIWKHTDELHPSDEEDIIRLQDDYDRN